MNHYYTSIGERVSQSQIDYRVDQAKKKKKILMSGSEFCEECGRSDTLIDMSHTIGIQECKNRRMVELSWSVDNLRLRCRSCHKRWDKSEIFASKL